MERKDITEFWTNEEVHKMHDSLCNARCDLEELAQQLTNADAQFNGKVDWEIQDIADEIAELENYLFEKYYNGK